MPASTFLVRGLLVPAVLGVLESLALALASVGGGIRVTLAAPPPALAGLGEVAQQLAGDRRGLAGHPHARPAQNLLGLGRVGDGGGQQRDREAAVLLARGVHDPARVAAVGAARRS